MRTFLIILSFYFCLAVPAQETGPIEKINSWCIIIGGSEGIKAFFVANNKGVIFPLSYFQINTDSQNFYSGSERLKATVCTVSNTNGTFDILINKSSYGASIILTNNKKCLSLEQIPQGRNISDESMLLIGEMNEDKSKELFEQCKVYFEGKKGEKVNFKDISVLLIKQLTFKAAEIGNKEMVDPYKWEMSVGTKNNIKVDTPQQPP